MLGGDFYNFKLVCKFWKCHRYFRKKGSRSLSVNENNEKNQVVRKALSMAAGTFSSRLLGLLREMGLW